MPTRKAQAHRSGDLKSGKGTMRLGSGAYEIIEDFFVSTAENTFSLEIPADFYGL